jgi:putative transcriptional regulator
MSDTVSGKLLVAMPGIGDPRFDHSVIMMCAHDSQHALGVIVNKPKDGLTVGEVLDHLGLEPPGEASERVVLDGGPVRPDRGFVLHSADFKAGDATRNVAPGLSLTATRDVLEAVAQAQAPRRYVLALGCSSWGAGQLEDELKRNAWLVVDFDDAIVFDEEHDDKWTRAIRSLGFDPSQLMGQMGRA